MKTITAYQTDDGVIHPDRQTATKHADVRYADQLRVTSALIHAGMLSGEFFKAHVFEQFLDANLERVVQAVNELNTRRRDLNIVTDEEED